MLSLKEIKLRITSVSSTRQITSAMRMVSAAKLKKAHDRILKIRPYADKLKGILEDVSVDPGKSEFAPLMEQRDLHHVLLVVITSNRGLCGAFNHNAARLAIEVSGEYLRHGIHVQVMSMGKKGGEILKNASIPVEHLPPEWIDHPEKETLYPIAEKIISDFTLYSFDKVELIYTQFQSAASQTLIREVFLPILPKTKQSTEKGLKSLTDFIFEPDTASVLRALLPEMLKMQFYKAIADSSASEHGARMISMQKATENASELIEELSMTYNKARQAGITREIVEIISGADAQKR